jgi:hypothetical protein
VSCGAIILMLPCRTRQPLRRGDDKYPSDILKELTTKVTPAKTGRAISDL